MMGQTTGQLLLIALNSGAMIALNNIIRIFLFFVVLSGMANAETYWISSNGTAANLASCSGATPLNGTDACSYDKANGAGVVAGDIVYYRAGTYTGITTWAIYPYNSGSSWANRITFSAYNGESVTFQGGANGSGAVRIDASKDYIYVTGIIFQNFGRMLRIGGVGGSADQQANYNEISYCTFQDMYDTVVAGEFYASRIEHSCYNWIHHNTFSNYGNPTSDADFGVVFEVGFDNGDDTTGDRLTAYNLIENNTFKFGLHHAFGLNGRYNIFRNNIVWNPPHWTAEDQTLWAGRGLMGINVADETDDQHHLIENNTIAYTGDTLEVYTEYNGGSCAGAGAAGLKIGTPNNIIRYNTIYQARLNGIEYDSRGGPSNNRAYHNTVWHNGYYDPAPVDPDCGPANPYRHAVQVPTTVSNNIFKNNIFWENRNIIDSDYTFILSNSNPPTTQVTDTNNWNDNNATNPLFVNISGDPDPTNMNQFNLTLQASSPAINAGTYHTTATRDDDNILSVSDARYFFDGWGIDTAFSGSGAIVAPDWVCFTESDTVVTYGNCKQIASGGADWDNNKLTVTGHGLLAETTYYVWLYKRSDGTIVLRGTAPDYGANEYDDTPVGTHRGMSMGGGKLQ